MFGGYMFCSYNMFGSYNIMLGFYDNMFGVTMIMFGGYNIIFGGYDNTSGRYDIMFNGYDDMLSFCLYVG